MIAWVFSIALGQLPAPLQVESAKPLPELTAKMTQTQGWTGSDGAYSIRLSATRTLFLYGDTWIGAVENGRRVRSRMINNSAAWFDLADAQKPMRFFWDDSSPDKPLALLKPKDAGTFYWPGDGAIIEGKLYLVAHVVRHKLFGPPGFQFEGVADDLLQITNPADEPTKWKIERVRLPGGLDWGAACYADGKHLYSFGRLPIKRFAESHLAVARIGCDRLMKLDIAGMEYWTKDGWSPKRENLEPITRDGASELSVQIVRGIDGLVMTYIPLGLGNDIAVRRADRPEGPWSERTIAYRIPKQAEKVFTYAGKGHAELATRDGQLIVTWCRNIGDLKDHMRQPDVYIPQAVEVMLKTK